MSAFVGIEEASSDGKLLISNIYQTLSDIHIVEPVTLRNRSTGQVQVRLRSSEPSLLNFQSENENVYAFGKAAFGFLRDVSTTSNDFTHLERHCNEAFNCVDLIDGEPVLLKAQETRQLFLVVNCCRPAASVAVTGGKYEMESQSCTLDLEYSVAGEPNQSEIVKYEFVIISCLSVLESQFSIPLALDANSYKLIEFNDCTIGVPQFREFVLQNCSAIRARFQILVDKFDANFAQVKFVDCDTGETADKRPLARFGKRRIRLSFKPLTQSQQTFCFRILNTFNPLNEERFMVSTFARPPADNSLILAPEELDFGACCVGITSKRYISLRNTSEYPIVVKLSCDCPDVIFKNRSTLSAEAFNDTSEIHDSTQSMSPVFATSPALSSVNTSFENISVLNSRAVSPSPSVADSEELSMYDYLDHEYVEKTLSAGNSELFKSNNPWSRNESSNRQTESGFDNTAIDEVSLLPHSEKRIEIEYCPQKSREQSNSNNTKLSQRNFRVYANYHFKLSNSPEKNKTVLCKSKVCESIIRVDPVKLDFGDVDVGTLKSMPIKIYNESDIGTNVQIRFNSKVLNAYRGEMYVPANQHIETKMEIFPRKVNQDYRKQVTIANLNNRWNDQVIEVLCRNEDRNRITFHSLFYNIINTPNSSNFIDFDTVVVNSTGIRTFDIENTLSTMDVKIELTSSSSEELQIFTLPESSPQSMSVSTYSKQDLIDAMDERLQTPSQGTNGAIVQPMNSSLSSSQNNIASPLSTETPAGYLDLATVTSDEFRNSPRKPPPRLRPIIPKSRTFADVERVLPDPSENEGSSYSENKKTGNSLESIDYLSSLNLDSSANSYISDLVAQLESHEKLLEDGFPQLSFEEKYLKSLLFLKKELAKAIENQVIKPISTVSLPPKSRTKFVILFTPSSKNRPYIKGKPKKHDTKIYLRLLDFDRRIEAPGFEPLLNGEAEIPVRELLVRSLLCRSMMEIGQKNINFGLVAKKERRTKTIVIYNRSEAPLYYAIRKSGSIASGDIHFSNGGKMGVLRGFGKREVEFVFCPSMPGVFYEKLAVENLLDRSNDQIVNVKAQIRKPSNFFIKSLLLDFGDLLINNDTEVQNHTATQNIIIDNTSNQVRYLEVSFDPKTMKRQGYEIEIVFELDRDPLNQGKVLSKEIEEQIEHLEQKLKIAKRKGQDAKVTKISEKISALRPRYSTDTSTSASVGQEDEPAIVKLPQPKVKKGTNFIVVSIEANMSAAIVVQLRLNRSTETTMKSADPEPVAATLNVCEHKNRDYTKQVEIKAVAYADQTSFTEAQRRIQTDEPMQSMSRTSSTATITSLSNENLATLRPSISEASAWYIVGSTPTQHEQHDV